MSKKLDNMTEKTWFSNECEVLRNECMTKKNFLTHEPSLDSYELYISYINIHVKNIRNVLIKPKTYIQKNSMIK